MAARLLQPLLISYAAVFNLKKKNNCAVLRPYLLLLLLLLLLGAAAWEASR
jgi:hypothetical protein